jgi:hypothetical protein
MADFGMRFHKGTAKTVRSGIAMAFDSFGMA